MSLQLDGKKALVTGSRAGIGPAVAAALAAEAPGCGAFCPMQGGRRPQDDESMRREATDAYADRSP